MNIPLPLEGLPPPSPRVRRRHDENVRQGLVDIDMRGSDDTPLPEGLAGLYHRDCGDGAGPAECGGRPTYTKADGTGMKLYFCEESSHWFIGANVGRALGIACARGEAHTPDQLHSGAWEVKDSGWRAVKSLQAHCVLAAPVMYHLA